MSKIHIYYTNCLFLSIACSGFSVSLSQFFLVLTFVFYLLDKKEKWHHNWIVYFIIAFIFSYLLSFAFHIYKTQYNISYIKKTWNGELKDLFLFLGFFVFQNLKKEDEKKIYFAFWTLAFILLITGFLSIFTSVRFNKLISELYTPTTTWRYTHFYGSLFNINFYLPVGFFSTHLTFGGLLSFFSPLFIFKFLFSLQKKKYNQIFYYLFLLCIFLFVSILNNSRSALFGSFFAIIFGFFHLFFIKKELPIQYLKWGLSTILLVVMVFFLTFLNIDKGKKILYPLLGKAKHTDSGRTFIWDSTFYLIKSNFLFGVGSNNYNKEIEKARQIKSELYPELLYFYKTIPKGHAHNDYLHLLVCFGILSCLIFIILAYRISFEILNSNLSSNQNLVYFYGLIGFFISGLLQCYFQDDEVVIVFWFLLGLLVRSVNLKKEQEESLKLL